MFGTRLDPITTSGDLILSVEMKDSETGELLDLTGATFDFALQRDQKTSTLTGSTADGHITNPALGIVHVQFLESELNDLDVGTYDAGLTIHRDGFSETLILGTIEILNGVAI